MEIIPGSIKIKNNIYWGGDFSKIIELINNDQIKESQIKFFLGYSGWEESQLETEISSSSWILVENEINKNLVFNKVDNIWKEKLNQIRRKLYDMV